MHPGLLYLHVAGIAIAVALLCACGSRRASMDVRLWLAIAIVASTMVVST